MIVLAWLSQRWYRSRPRAWCLACWLGIPRYREDCGCCAFHQARYGGTVVECLKGSVGL